MRCWNHISKSIMEILMHYNLLSCFRRWTGSIQHMASLLAVHMPGGFFRDMISFIGRFWLHGPCGWLERQMHLYQDIPVAYGSLVDALLKPEYEPLLCRIFPFRLTDSTLRPCHGMDANEWELFTFKLSKVLHFAEHWNGQRNVDDKIAEDMVRVLNKVRYYMECEKI